MNIAGMILGIVAAIFAFIPVFGAFVAIPCVVVGLPLSGVSFAQLRRSEQGTGMAIAGIVTNIIALILVIVWIVIVAVG